MHLNSLIVSIAALSVCAVASAIPSNSLEDYQIVTPTISGVYNGQNFSLQGTVDSVYAQLQDLHGPDTSSPQLAARDDSHLIKRTKGGILCIPVKGQNWGLANYDQVNAMITSLNVLISANGVARMPGRSCGALACNNKNGWTLGIFICNDSVWPTAPTFAYMQTFAQDLVNQCTNKGPGGQAKSSAWASGGQEFDDDDFNIIVRGGIGNIGQGCTGK